jgi:hypothetical protein
MGKKPTEENPATEPGFLFAIESVSLTANSAASSTTQPCANGAGGATSEFVADD